MNKLLVGLVGGLLGSIFLSGFNFPKTTNNVDVSNGGIEVVDVTNKENVMETSLSKNTNEYEKFTLEKARNNVDNAEVSKVGIVVVDVKNKENVMATYLFENPDEYEKFDLEKELSQLNN